MDELDEILGEGEKKPDPTESDPSKEGEKEKKEEPKKDPELEKKEQQLKNLNIAIQEANSELAKIRKEKKITKTDEDELPEIDPDDPSVKAWDKRVSGRVDPIMVELEKSRSEIRSVAIKEFLGDHPALAKSPEKVKEVMQMYERVRTTTESSKEGVRGDLNKAFGAVFGEELVGLAQKRRIDEAKAEEIFADAAISRGATTYSDEKKPDSEGKVKITKEELALVRHKWGMSDEEIKKYYTVA